METGRPLFPGDNQFNQLEYIIKILGNLPEYLVNFYDNNPNFNINKLLTIEKPKTLEKIYGKIMSPDALDFMKGLLELDPKKRLNADTVFDHKYFECYKNTKNNENNDNNMIFSFCIDDKKKIKIPNLGINNNKEKESKIINIFRYNDESFISETNESTLSKKKIKKPEKNYNNLMKSFQNKKHRHYRSDMVDFGNIYLLSENNRKREKNKDKSNKREENEVENSNEDEDNKKEENNNNKEEINKQKEEYNNNINKKDEILQISQKIEVGKFNELYKINNSRSQLNQLNLSNKGLNHKISFSMIKNNNNFNSSSNKSNTEENYPLLTPNFLALNKLSEKKITKNKKK